MHHSDPIVHFSPDSDYAQYIIKFDLTYGGLSKTEFFDICNKIKKVQEGCYVTNFDLSYSENTGCINLYLPQNLLTGKIAKIFIEAIVEVIRNSNSGLVYRY